MALSAFGFDPRPLIVHVVVLLLIKMTCPPTLPSTHTTVNFSLSTLQQRKNTPFSLSCSSSKPGSLCLLGLVENFCVLAGQSDSLDYYNGNGCQVFEFLD